MRKLLPTALLATGIAGAVAAHDQSGTCHDLTVDSPSPYTIQAGDTLTCVANHTGLDVATIMALNPHIAEQFAENFPQPRNKAGQFGNAPKHTIYPENPIFLTGETTTEVGDITDTLRSSGINDERIAGVRASIEAGIINIPGLTVENATQVAIALERIPKDRSISILIDNSGSTNNDRELISQFVQFFISDWTTRKEIISGEGDTNTVKTYAYSTFSIEVTGNENEYVDTGDGGTENNVLAIQNAFGQGAEHVVVITDEPGSDNERLAIEGQKENTTLFVIDDAGASALINGDEIPENYYDGLKQHGTVYILEGQGGE